MKQQFSHADFQQNRQKKACFRKAELLTIHMALCHSEMKRSGIELMAELLLYIPIVQPCGFSAEQAEESLLS
ncbi:hypothetical protein [Novisyntrophococcus fermenticellae]|uniref:hypothetical protein n=1 Tax=Novisyntrophococcus fermenticellae TaxID=2068655 RepID=UPI001E3416E7|nr:hypothetical protein [Novisyntrophococcus fermenticellae]